MTNPCPTCVRGCCHRHTVGVSGTDVQASALGLDLAPALFLQAIAEPGVRGFLLSREGPAYQLALAKRPADTFPAPCLFLLELPDGTGRCGIYTLRPLVCQTYPAYTRNGLVGRRDDVLCPTEAWHDDTLTDPVWYERLAHQALAFDLYELVVARWNYHLLQNPPTPPRELADYYTYLTHIYAQLKLICAQVADWNAFCAAWDACLDRGAQPLRAACPELQPWQPTLDAIRSAVATSLPTTLAPQLLAELAQWETGILPLPI